MKVSGSLLKRRSLINREQKLLSAADQYERAKEHHIVIWNDEVLNLTEKLGMSIGMIAIIVWHEMQERFGNDIEMARNSAIACDRFVEELTKIPAPEGTFVTEIETGSLRQDNTILPAEYLSMKVRWIHVTMKGNLSFYIAITTDYLQGYFPGVKCPHIDKVPPKWFERE